MTEFKNIDIYSSDVEIANSVKDCINELTFQARRLTKISDILKSQNHLGMFHRAIVSTSSIDHDEILNMSLTNISSIKSDLEDLWRKFESLAVFGVGADRESLIYELAQLIDQSRRLYIESESEIAKLTSNLNKVATFLDNQISTIQSLT